MGLQSTEDFLTKQILIEGNIITYRFLSRQIPLHVNAAKNALASFYSKVKREGESKLAATYLISGELTPAAQESKDVDVDVDMEKSEENVEYQDDGAEEVQSVEVVLVGEKDLEHTKSKFSTIYSIHIYCLSPTSLRDMGLICGPNEIVREIDTKKGSEMAAIVGKTVGNVKEGKGKSCALPPPPPVAAMRSVSTPTESRSIKKNTSTFEKPKASDFFTKAKPRDSKDPKEVSKKEAENNSTTENPANSTAGVSKVYEDEVNPPKYQKERSSGSKNEQIKRSKAERRPSTDQIGAKRKLYDPESKDGEKRSSITVKKNTIVSDDDEEQPAPKVARAKDKGKSKQIAQMEDEDVLAMMDVDDDQVIRISRSRKASPEPLEAVKSEAEDVEMQDDNNKPATKTRRKIKTKKIVPVGKNGLKKKRVTKQRVTTDAKGYVVTEDYSSYESVNEAETDSMQDNGKQHATDKAAGTNNSRMKEEEEEEGEEDIGTASAKSKPAPKPKPKPKTSSTSGRAPGGGHKNIASFFGKPKGNK